MNTLRVFILIFTTLIILFSPVEAVTEVPFTIINNKIIAEDSDIYFTTDYIKKGSGWIYPEIKYKNLPGNAANVDIAFGVNADEMRFTKAEYWNPHHDTWETQHQQNFYNVEIVGVYNGTRFDYGNSYNTYKRTITHDVANGSKTDRVISNVSFDSYESWNGHYTIFWHTDHEGTINWSPIPDEKIRIYNYEYDNKTKWYIISDIAFEENIAGKMRIWVELKHDKGAQSYKYDFATKLSSETLSEAITNNRLKLVDPYGDATNFNSTWNTSKTSTGSTNNTSIKLPLEASGTYDFTIWWGDGNSDNITTWNQQNTTHTYAAQGEYDIVIDGTIQGWRFNNGGDRLKIINITNWGNLIIGNSNGYFYGCSNLNVGATDILDTSSVTTFAYAFRDCSALTTLNTSGWDTSSVTTFHCAFYGCSALTTLDASNWNISSCTDFTNMFYGVTLSTTSYDSVLNAFAATVTSSNQDFHGGSSKYSLELVASRNTTLIGKYSWTITDGGLSTGAYIAYNQTGSLWNCVDTSGTVTYSGDVLTATYTVLNAASITGTANISMNSAGAGETYNFTINSGTVDWLNVTDGLVDDNDYRLMNSTGLIEIQTVDVSGSVNFTTNITIGTYYIESVEPIESPSIISYSPNTPVTSTKGTNQTFIVNISEIVDVIWYLDSVEVFNETNVNTSSYWNSTTPVGIYNITVMVTNPNGLSNSMTWNWTVTLINRMPISIFIMWSVIMFMGMIIGFMTTGLYGIASSLLTAAISYMNSKNIINGNVVQYFAGESTTDTIEIGYRSIESLPISYIYLFISIIMIIVFFIQVGNEIQYQLEPDIDGEFLDE